MTNPPTSTTRLLQALRERGIRHILIGGFAVNYHGYSRTTFDIDFMVDAEDIVTISRVARALAYQDISEQDNVLFLKHSDTSVRLDFLKTDAATINTLLERAEHTQVNEASTPVVCLRDLLATKLFALRSAPARRRAKDLQDIVWLAMLHHLPVEDDLKEMCAEFGTPNLLRKIDEQLTALRRELSP